MFDCGMHMGYDDHRRFPDFSQIQPDCTDYTQHIDAVFITHFHLDHCGALPHFSEICGYNGPIVMSAPTKAIIPLMLEDFRKVAVEHRGEHGMFTSTHISQCVQKISTIELHQVVTIGKDIRATMYYAGHVIGAVMFYVEVNGYSVVYTGDYNMTSDRHLGAAWIERLSPHVVISESTYATKFRELRMKREKAFLQQVIETIDAGGKVLVPVFALGRA
jgi:integrator complex subunit 11